MFSLLWLERSGLHCRKVGYHATMDLAAGGVTLNLVLIIDCQLSPQKDQNTEAFGKN
jgi:hypothetical protein